MATETIDVRERVTEMVKDVRVCMLTTMTESGKHVSRPMAVQDAEFDGDLWFFTYNNSHKVAEVQKMPDVNVAFSDDKSGSWVSIAGRAEVIHDRNKAEDLWSPVLKAWFPDGLDTEGLSLLKVHADSAEFWDTPSSKVATAISLAKSVATGKTADKELGDNAAGEL